MLIAGRRTLMTTAVVPKLAPLFSRGTQQFAFFQTPDINTSEPLAFGGWFKGYEVSENGECLFCGWSQSGGWGSTHITNSGVRFGVGDSSGAHGISNPLPKNEWMHLVAAYDGTNITLYKNGSIYQQWDVGSQKRNNNENVFRIAAFSEGSFKYSSVAAFNVFVAAKVIGESDAKALCDAPFLKGVSCLAGENVYGAYNMTEADSQDSFASAIGGAPMSINDGFTWVESPFA